MSDESDVPFAEALVRALGALTDIVRTQTANAGTYTYRYADLASVLAVVRTTLAEHGFAVSQPPTTSIEHGIVSVETILLHTSGESYRGGMLGMRLPPTPQQLGSMITYLRRYSLMGVCGLATEDDDGAAAATAPAQAAVSPPAPRYDDHRPDTPEERLRATAGALFSALGLQPSQRIERMAAILGRDVDSWGELSLLEQRRVVEQLQADRVWVPS